MTVALAWLHWVYAAPLCPSCTYPSVPLLSVENYIAMTYILVNVITNMPLYTQRHQFAVARLPTLRKCLDTPMVQMRKSSHVKRCSSVPINGITE